MIKKVIIITLLFFSKFNLGWAQQKNTDVGNQQWVHYFNQMKLSERWSLTADGGLRWRDRFENYSQYIVRIGTGYALHDRVQFAVGIANVGSYSSGKIIRMEFRPYQDVVLRKRYGVVGVQHRVRVEERLFKTVSNGEFTSRNNFDIRFRYGFNMLVPLFKLSVSNPEAVMHLNIGDEVFLNVGREMVTNVFDQNRILIGPVAQFNKNYSVGLIYNGHFASTRIPDTYRYDHILWLQIRHAVNFTKEKSE